MRSSFHHSSPLGLLASRWSAASLADGSFGLLTSPVIFLFGAMLFLSGCLNQSDVQADYVAQQTECRSVAEDRMEALPGSGDFDGKKRNAVLVDQFSGCMVKAGWHVARPVKPQPQPQPRDPRYAQNPSQPLPGQPSNVITTLRPAPQPNQQIRIQQAPQPTQNIRMQPQQQQPVRTQSTQLPPSRSMAPLNEPAPQNLPSGAAVYQPVGRQF